MLFFRHVTLGSSSSHSCTKKNAYRAITNPACSDLVSILNFENCTSYIDNNAENVKHLVNRKSCTEWCLIGIYAWSAADLLHSAILHAEHKSMNTKQWYLNAFYRRPVSLLTCTIITSGEAEEKKPSFCRRHIVCNFIVWHLSCFCLDITEICPQRYNWLSLGIG